MTDTEARFHPDHFGSLSKIGLIYMASSTVMEPEMYAMAAEGVSVHTSRLTLPKVTVAGIDKMMHSAELETAAQLVAQAPLDTLCFGGTSASFLYGTDWDRSIIERLEQWSSLTGRCTTTSSASLAALRKVDAGPIALATPYADEVIQRAVRFFSDNEFPVVATAGLGITSDWELADVPLKNVFDLAVDVDRPEATAVFISCTNLRSVGALAALEDRLGKPVISAVQASFWHCLELADVNGGKSGYGSLLDRRAAM